MKESSKKYPTFDNSGNFTRSELIQAIDLYREKCSIAQGAVTPTPFDNLQIAICEFLGDTLAATYTPAERSFDRHSLRFCDMLPGLLFRILKGLETPQGYAADHFLEKCSEIRNGIYHDDLELTCLCLLGIESLEYEVDIMCALDMILGEVLPRHTYYHCREYLYADSIALGAHFQNFLAEVWAGKGARQKHEQCKKRSLSGIFGETCFTTWEGIGWIVFQFSDQSGNAYLNFRTYSSTPEGYGAGFYSGNVSLATGLSMMQDVSQNFNLDGFNASNATLFPGL